MRRFFTQPTIYAAIILSAAVFICFGRTLGSYFLADDFGEVAYVSKIFEGDLARLWSNFTGNYMQVPSMAVYRPWLLMSLVFDYAVWSTNAFGYYLTNLLHYLACTLLICALVKLLTSYWGKWRSWLAATFSGLIFAVHPLHCESVSWVVGRVDIVSLTFYLLGLVSTAMYVRDLKRKWLFLTFASFWLGILTKEMAIALPVTATALAFLWGNLSCGRSVRQSKQRPADDSAEQKYVRLQSSDAPAPELSPAQSRAAAVAALQKVDQETAPAVSADGQSAPVTIRERTVVALPVAVMLFACTVIYFAIRYACLGTITGGYTGSIGSSQFDGILEKWSDMDTLMRIVFPLNHFVFEEGSAQKNVLSAIYIALVALVTTRLLAGSTPRRWLVFLALSGLTALAPIYQLWGIGHDLEGSRFVFFLTVPLAMLFPIILFAPLERNARVEAQPERFKTSLKLMALSTIILSLLVFVFARITLANNIPWVHAGKQTESIHERAVALSSATPRGKQVAVIGIPKDEGGAHMILNGTTFKHLITPPFAETGLTGKILTFEPVLFGDPEKVDTGHFHEALRNPHVQEFLVWNMDKRDFVPFKPGTLIAVPQSTAVAVPNLTTPAASGLPRASFPYTRGRGEIDPRGSIAGAKQGLGLRISGMKIFPSQFDFVVLTARGSDFLSDKCTVQIESVSGGKTSFESRFSTERSKDTCQIRIPVSAYWKFYSAGEIGGMTIDFPAIEKLSVERLELCPAALVAPVINVVDKRRSDDGSFLIRSALSKQAETLRISADASMLDNAAAIELQVLKKNFFFDNIASEAALQNSIQEVRRSKGQLATFDVPERLLSSSGYVQLRLKCVDGQGRQIGEFSFPVTLRVVVERQR